MYGELQKMKRWCLYKSCGFFIFLSSFVDIILRRLIYIGSVSRSLVGIIENWSVKLVYIDHSNSYSV